RDLAFGGVTYAARTGLEAAEASAELGFAVGGGEVSGALVSAGLTEDDLAAGLYDDASVETWLVNWANPQERLLLDVGAIGEIRRADGAFVAEARGLMHRLDEERGRLYGATCAADLGDGCCRVDLSGPAFTATAVASATDGALGLLSDGLEGYHEGFFTGGRLLWLEGANAGLAAEIKAHRREGASARLELWQRAARPIAAGDAFRATAGCDKRFATCRQKFGNVANFRGFPHMPGNDFVVRLAAQGEPGMDGGSFFR
ncbi:MAG: Gene Transfer Agent FAD/FMN-containing dehydrogenase, partial [uncultured Microvirga sp.]